VEVYLWGSGEEARHHLNASLVLLEEEVEVRAVTGEVVEEEGGRTDDACHVSPVFIISVQPPA
jgi:hypothetical protein